MTICGVLPTMSFPRRRESIGTAALLGPACAGVTPECPHPIHSVRRSKAGPMSILQESGYDLRLQLHGDWS
jgi:hypothetical protein